MLWIGFLKEGLLNGNIDGKVFGMLGAGFLFGGGAREWEKK